MQNILKQTIGSFLNILCGLGSSPGTFSNSAWGLCMGWPAGLWGGRWATKPAFRGGVGECRPLGRTPVSVERASSDRIHATIFGSPPTRFKTPGAWEWERVWATPLWVWVWGRTPLQKKNSQSSPGCRSRRCRPWGRRLRGGNRPPRRCRCPAGREDWGGPPVAEYPRPTPC